jgi:hypothetical protein
VDYPTTNIVGTVLLECGTIAYLKCFIFSDKKNQPINMSETDLLVINRLGLRKAQELLNLYLLTLQCRVVQQSISFKVCFKKMFPVSCEQAVTCRVSQPASELQQWQPTRPSNYPV